MQKKFQVESHTADLKIRVFGSTYEELFKNALIGMFQSIGPSAPNCSQKNNLLVCNDLPISRELNVYGENLEDVLINFLSEALYLSDVHNEAYLDAVVYELSAQALKASLKGVPVSGFEIEIKAVTYHECHITKMADGRWTTELVFDI
ncbi:MAG TPA: archease [Candidatus Babeliales bacterium]|nr:archease [Candidatus Babeliales bacterium]